MTQDEMDEKLGDTDTSSDSSTDQNSDSSDGADSDNNADEDVKLKKSEWEATRKELNSVKLALKQERERNRNKGLSSPVEGNEEEDGKPARRKNDDVRAIIQEEREKEQKKERVQFEEVEKTNILKRFPKLVSDNQYGIDEQILENYNILLEGRKARNLNPRTQADVAKLLEHAVKMTYPDLFVQEEKERNEKGETYTGMETGMSQRGKAPAKQYTQKENQLKATVDAMIRK